MAAWIGLGANLGDAPGAVRAAIDALGALPLTTLSAASSLWTSAPVDAQGPDFVNAVARIETRLTAPDLLRELQALESGAGRERPYRNAPRTLDLDLLLYGAAHIDSPTLTVPHPRLWQRAFVLLPLHEIDPARVPEAALLAVAGQRIARRP